MCINFILFYWHILVYCCVSSMISHAVLIAIYFIVLLARFNRMCVVKLVVCEIPKITTFFSPILLLFPSLPFPLFCFIFQIVFFRILAYWNKRERERKYYSHLYHTFVSCIGCLECVFCAYSIIHVPILNTEIRQNQYACRAFIDM